jgi:26S proteasome non-ATPase regulatory subunit 10
MESEDKYPLHTAAREGRVTVAEGLLKSDPKLSQRKDNDGRYPIHWAASSNNFEIVQLLANQRSFDADVQVSYTLRHTRRTAEGRVDDQRTEVDGLLL